MALDFVTILSTALLKERSSVHSNTDDTILRQWIKVAQDLKIKNILGVDLFNKILNDIKTSNLSGDYKTLVDNYILEPLVYYTLYYLPINLTYQYYNKGTVKKTSENSESVSMSDIRSIQNDNLRIAETYGNDLQVYLQENSTKYPEYSSGKNCSTFDSVYDTGWNLN